MGQFEGTGGLHGQGLDGRKIRVFLHLPRNWMWVCGLVKINEIVGTLNVI
jgi:hypothetical protein